MPLSLCRNCTKWLCLYDTLRNLALLQLLL